MTLARTDRARGTRPRHWRSCSRRAPTPKQADTRRKARTRGRRKLLRQCQERQIRSIPALRPQPDPPLAGNIIVNQMYVHFRIPAGSEGRSAGAGARLQPHRHDLRDDAGRARRMGDLVRAPGAPGLRGRSFRTRPLRIQSDADQCRPRRRRRPESDADAVPRPDRSRLVEFPVRPGISEAVSPTCNSRSRRWSNTWPSSCPTPKPHWTAAATTPSTHWRPCSTRSARRW